MKPAELLRTGVLAVVFAAGGLGAGGAPARAGVITLDVTGTMTVVSGAVACSPTCTLGGTIVINNSPPDPGWSSRKT